MAGKLKSVIRNPRFGLLLKAVLFGVLLRWYGNGGGIFPAVVFLVGAIALYARPTFNALQFSFSFVLLAGLSLAGPHVASGTALTVLTAALAALFYLLLRLKELLFIRRLWWHETFVGGILYLCTLFYFLAWGNDGFLMKHALLGISFFLLSYELFATQGVRAPFARYRVGAGALTLLYLQIVWAVALLPIGYASATGIAALFGFVLLHLAVYDATGLLRASTIRRHIALAALLAVVIALASQWKR